MNGDKNPTSRSDGCSQLTSKLQDYVDGTLPKAESMELFLHLRDCSPCQHELAELEQVLEKLNTLPQHEVPADFNSRILTSIPYQAYKDMEPLRRDRLPVFLEEDFLPAAIRSVQTRLAGGLVSLLTTAGLAASWLPDYAFVVAICGIIPEAMVRLQRLARKKSLSGQRSESG
ncbi:MAG: zf-HC2 domain-containing protein [bacterium]